jgi:hypothetical protein
MQLSCGATREKSGMKWTLLIVGAVGSAAVAASPLPPSAANPKALEDVVGCRNISDPAQRLACFDDKVGALQTATAKRDIVVVDRQEVRQVRHSLFGFTLPSLPIFGDGGADHTSAEEPEEKEITATVRSARQDGEGNWIFTLDDGAVWHQTGGVLAISPKPGSQIMIRRAALGSYFVRVGKQPGIKARRES